MLRLCSSHASPLVSRSFANAWAVANITLSCRTLELQACEGSQRQPYLCSKRASTIQTVQSISPGSLEPSHYECCQSTSKVQAQVLQTLRVPQHRRGCWPDVAMLSAGQGCRLQ